MSVWNSQSDARLESLLGAWQLARAGGRELSAEDLCPDDPASQAALRERIFAALAADPVETSADPDRTADHAGARAGTAAASPVPGYDIQEEIGRGGMGVVYLARDTKLNRLVALKMIIGTNPGARGEMIRFLAEAEAVAAIDHPNVVRVYEYGEAGGRPYMALEYVTGGSLAHRLKAEGPTAPRRAAELVGRIAHGVAAAHALGIVHRDLKPGNILLTDAGPKDGAEPRSGSAARPQKPPEVHDSPKVADFGLAKRAGGSDLTHTNAVMGTPAYMAPEQARGETKFVGPQADVWALGAILYECLTGKRPFEGDSAHAVIRAVIDTEPTSPRRLVPQLPRDLELICLKCLSKDAAGRYPTAQELAADLDRFVAGEPILARPVGLAERVYKWAKRKPVLAGLYAATAVVLALAAVGWALMVQNRKVELARDKEEEARIKEEEARIKSDASAAEAVAQRAESQRFREKYKTINYYRQVERAIAAWGDNDALRAAYLLLTPDPDRRDWEWRYVGRLLQSELLRIPATAFVGRFGTSPDGRRLVAGVDDGTAPIWDLETGRVLFTYRGHPKQVYRAVFHPDGARVLSLGKDGEVHIWEAATGKTLRVFKLPGKGSYCLTLDPEGRRVAAGTHDGTVVVWNVETGEELARLQGHRATVTQALFLPKNRLLSLGIEAMDGSLRAWDLGTRKEIVSARQQHPGGAWALALAPDGKHVLSTDETGRIYTWDAATLAPVSDFVAHGGRIWDIVYSPDRERVLTVSLDQTARIWDAKTWKPIRTIRGHTNDVIAGAFLSGDRVVTGGDTTIRIWDATRDPEARVLTGDGPFEGVTFDATGERVAAASPTGISVWEAATGKRVGEFGTPGQTYRAVALSPDGKAIAGGGGDGVRIWPLSGGPSRKLGGHQATLMAVAYAPTGNRLASIDFGGKINVWDSTSWSTVWSATAPKGGMALAFSPDGTQMATGGADQTIRIWDAASGKELRVLTGHSSHVSRVAFSADGKKLVSGSHDNTIRRWDVATGKQEWYKKGHVHFIDGVAISPDGKRVADAAGDRTVKLYDHYSDDPRNDEALILKGHTDWVTGVVFSPNGDRLATCARDGTVRIWDAPHGVVVTLPAEADQPLVEK